MAQMPGRKNRPAVRSASLVFAASCVMWLAPPAAAQGDGEVIIFGQSACFTGPNGHLGVRLRAGIDAAFREANGQGGVNGRPLELVAIDDAYEPQRAAENAERFVARRDVFAVIGGVGTSTAKRIAPILRDAGIPFVGAFTGADILRNFERYPHVVNLRASYLEEIEVLVKHMVNELGKRRFGVIYQDDTFGRLALANYRSVLDGYDLPIIAKSFYSPNTHAVHSSLFTLAKADLDAVLLIGSHAANADVINLAVSLGHDYVMANLSIVASHDLYERLDNLSETILERILVAEVVPDPEDPNLELVRRFHGAIDDAEDYSELREDLLGLRGGHFGDTVALEGYIVGRFVIDVLSRLGEAPTREAFLATALQSEPVQIDDWTIQIPPGTNTGSTYVRLIDLAGSQLMGGDDQ